MGDEGVNQHNEFMFVYVDFEVLYSYTCILTVQKERKKTKARKKGLNWADEQGPY